MEQDWTQKNTSDAVLYLTVCGCQIKATFSPVANQNVYQRVKQILVDTYTQKATSSCGGCSE